MGRKKKANSVTLYFNKDTEKAIIAYQNEPEMKMKEKLYVHDILPAFDKLVENLIFIYKFKAINQTFDEMKNDCICFLYEKIHKYDHSRGTKAFSYFNVVAKNWLINNSKQSVKKLKRDVSLDDPTLTSTQKEIIEHHQIVQSPDVFLFKEVAMKELIELLECLRGEIVNKNETACIHAITYLFKNLDKIDLLNKRAVYLYLRELSGLNSKQLTVAMSSIKKKYVLVKVKLKKQNYNG